MINEQADIVVVKGYGIIAFCACQPAFGGGLSCYFILITFTEMIMTCNELVVFSKIIDVQSYEKYAIPSL